MKWGLGIQAAQPMPETKTIFSISIRRPSMARRRAFIRIPWPHPGQKGVPFNPGRRYFSMARLMIRSSSRRQ